MVAESITSDGTRPSCRLTRNEVGLITSVEESMVEVLGWRPDQLVGSPSTDLIHPDDQASGVAAWVEMIAAPGTTRGWRGRYRTAAGDWQWVESVNSNRLDDADNPMVVSVMSRIAVTEMSVEEELRARKQIISRLADALPVGIFQIDSSLRITFTNDRLHDILGVRPATDTASQFGVVVDQDRARLDSALRAVLNDEPVDDLELRFGVSVPHPDFATTRVCQVSLRPLTDRDGSVTGAIGCLSDITASVELRRELEIRASVDGLTGCLNRSATFELLDLALHQPSTAESGLAVIFVDLDRFKEVNDHFGHAVGDHSLAVAADQIRAAVRGVDTVGRIGGDEFLVVCPDVPSSQAALPVARRVAESTRLSITIADGVAPIQLGASVGLAWTNRASISPDALVARADRAMYQAKQNGTCEVALGT
jgi:diguanylate cyclase (GGDEF)-like protein/PAS domain S-box-containing protein